LKKYSQGLFAAHIDGQWRNERVAEKLLASREIFG
jgi:hypothetical protein